uniref:hypothetical protein n=1 Tax=Vibrio splendidus TaxID=29497 RepID=UPI0011471B14
MKTTKELYEMMFESEMESYDCFLRQYRKDKDFIQYSKSLPFDRSLHWFAFHTILMSELDCIWAGEHRHREEAHTQNLLTALKKNADFLNVHFKLPSEQNKSNAQRLALISIDLQRGQEAKSGGDIVLVLEIKKEEARKFYPMIIQVKRLSEKRVDLTRNNSYGEQINTLKNNQATSRYLYFSESSQEFENPYPPVLKKISDILTNDTNDTND